MGLFMVDCLHGSTILFVKTPYMGLFMVDCLHGSTIVFAKTAYMGLFYGRLLTWVYHFVCKDTLHGSTILFVKTPYVGLFMVDCLHGSQALDDWTNFFFFFFLHFHPFGDPYDMFMQLFYLKNLFYQSSINHRLWATI